MKLKKISVSVLFLIATSMWIFSCEGKKEAVEQEDQSKNVFDVVNPDFEISPYTGMTRQHWKDAALYLLEGAFSYVDDLDDPMKFPKLPGKSYPHDENSVPTEKLEGLCRTLFVAAPLLKDDPELTIGGLGVAEYYRHQIMNLLDSTDASYIPHRREEQGPTQILVEFGALGMSLFVAPDILWEPLSQQDKDKLAATMLSYGDGPTVSSNWKFFNIFVLSFFKGQGYDVNEDLLVEYLHKSLEHYRADGWYNDAPAYDYYSMWAFQLYGSMWSEVFGNQYYPEISAKFLSNFEDMVDNYPYLFSEHGEMIMFGRSISYRMGSVAPFPFMGQLEGKDINLGWLRRISSGVLLQFLQNPAFMKDSVPTLGFYDHFEPAVQNYSCRGSVYWMGKAFLGLLIPEDSPFWTVQENNGPWEKEFEKDQVYNKFQDISNLLITDYPNIGASEVRIWCHEKVADDWQKFRSTENYNRLSYNSAFPWQADGPDGEVAMNYLIKNAKEEWEAFRLYTFRKYEDEIYYRDVVLETDGSIKMQLAEMPLPNGILRVDRNLSNKAIDMRLGHYALPKLDQEITSSTQTVGGYEASIIDNGEYQLAMIPLSGWDSVEVVTSTGLNPVSHQSTVLNAVSSYSFGSDSNIHAVLMLWKWSGETWTKEDLMPVKEFRVEEDVSFLMPDGSRKVIY
ncbi:hypothetical protein SAMN04488028_101118 [Reichenbachiella agariperforans]|uniref:DUF2264 domain-containing protein n=1 Tax=Reichenbachiella agariperforans TaxID=156994 RepID=A0A1M6JB67_REIAG|nr:DUF2264 domain-containing protein [Reichenbachiella agariperforans]SHJ43904.1 hypothetical protein SAMN04488028_101118 [Reichenbachiella agariperforans]